MLRYLCIFWIWGIFVIAIKTVDFNHTDRNLILLVSTPILLLAIDY